MNQSKTGLNDSFYKWIDQVRRSKRKLTELQEKLQFYNMKFIGYNGVSYEFSGSKTGGSKGDENLLYWMGKIDTVNKELQILDEVIRKYDDFLETLNVIEQKVLTQLVSLSSLKAISLQLDVKTESLIQIRTRIANKWYRL